MPHAKGRRDDKSGMKITYFWFNAFIIEGEGKKIVIDPGGDFGFRPRSLIPEDEWEGTDIILITHGDFDHFKYVPPLAEKTKAKIICSSELGEKLSKINLSALTVKPGEEVVCDSLKIKGVPVRHGPQWVANLKEKHPDFGKKIPEGFGSIGFLFQLEGKTICNLADSLLLEEWKDIECDILMIPVGGLSVMVTREAVEAVKLIKPEIVIPVHYNYGKRLTFIWNININDFKEKIEKEGYKCLALKRGESFSI